VRTIIFDLDGTLLRQVTYPVQTRCLFGAMEHVHGFLPDGYKAIPIDRLGKTDLGVAYEMFLYLGGAPSGYDEPGVIQLYCELFNEVCPEYLVGEVRTGWYAVLGKLESQAQFRIATGNCEPVARIKMQRARLAIWFDLERSGYGASRNRVDVLSSSLGDALDPIYVCDTARDVAAARELGIPTIALVTEEQTADELAEADQVVLSPHELVEALA
jgi:phosphoglycolate phosphatase-like HAD superfamily hydrolase